MAHDKKSKPAQKKPKKHTLREEDLVTRRAEETPGLRVRTGVRAGEKNANNRP